MEANWQDILAAKIREARKKAIQSDHPHARWNIFAATLADVLDLPEPEPFDSAEAFDRIVTEIRACVLRPTPLIPTVELYSCLNRVATMARDAAKQCRNKP